MPLMSFLLKQIPAEQFDAFYEAYEGEKTFLQTSKYAEYRKHLGEGIFLYGLFVREELVGIALIQKISAKRGVFLHVPHGPIIRSESQIREDYTDYTDYKFERCEEIMKDFLSEYVELGKREKCDFVRVAPLFSLPSLGGDGRPVQIVEGGRSVGVLSTEEVDAQKIFLEQSFRPAPVHLVNPEKTWVLDLQQSEEELLKNMRKSTRYEVRRIEKMGIKVCMGNRIEDLDIFWALHEETVKRQKFVPFTRKSTEKELEIWGKDCQVFSAEVEGKYLSSSVILFDSHAAYYHQGASVYSKLPAAHATLWWAILEAKKRGCKEFNFWGICGEDQNKHPWYGLSRFKRGFGGMEKNFLHVQDYPLTWRYWISWVVEKWRKWTRGY